MAHTRLGQTMECSLSPTHGNRVCCCFSFLYLVCVPDSMLHTSTRITGVPPPLPPRRPRIFTTARARTAIKIVDYEYPLFSQGKAPWGRGCGFPSRIVERAKRERAWKSPARERGEKNMRAWALSVVLHFSLSLACWNDVVTLSCNAPLR